METESPNPSAPVEPPPPVSLPARLLNVYAAPGEVFDELRVRPVATSNWLVPIILVALVGIATVLIMFSQPAIVQQMQTLQQARYDQLVEEGKLSREQADAMQERLAGFTATVGRIAGMVGAVFGSFAWLFLISLVLFLLLRWVFHAPVPFMKTVETIGLSQMIGVLGGIVAILVMVIKGSMFATVGPALFISDYDPQNKLHLLASSLNVFTLWWIAVVAIGLARVAAVSTAKIMITLFALWALLRVAVVFSGLGSGGM